MKFTVDCRPQPLSLLAMQVSVPQAPEKTARRLSKAVPVHRLAVRLPHWPEMVYHTPGAVASASTQPAGAPWLVAPAVVPVTGVPQLTGMAPAHRSLAGGPVRQRLKVPAVPAKVSTRNR